MIISSVRVPNYKFAIENRALGPARVNANGIRLARFARTVAKPLIAARKDASTDCKLFCPYLSRVTQVTGSI